MKNLNEVIEALKAQMNEVEAMFNNKNKEITFTKEELLEYTKTISNAVANGVKYELSKIDNFNFKPALMSVRENGEMVIKVSRTKAPFILLKNTHEPIYPYYPILPPSPHSHYPHPTPN